jgi:integrase
LIYHRFLSIFQGGNRAQVRRLYAPVSGDFRVLSISVCTLRARFRGRVVATIKKLPSGTWRVQVRRKGHYLSDSFVLRKDAEAWARRMESEIDQGKTPAPKRVEGVNNFGDLIDLHIADMKAVGRAIGRSKSFSLEFLKKQLGKVRLGDLGRERLIAFGRQRAKGGAGPITVGMDLGYIRTLLADGAAIHGLPYSPEPVDLARIALARLGLVGKGDERDRRPTEDELLALFRYFDGNSRLTIPMSRIVRFAIASAMRQDEICRVVWADFNPRRKILTIKDRKDPREKKGNHQTIPLLAVSGYDAVVLIEEERLSGAGNGDRIFPYNGRSVGTAFRRACQDLEISDLHFHDLRHEGTSRLFEAGFSIEQVALVTGHKDWKMLRRYTHLKPDSLHAIAERLPGSRPLAELGESITNPPLSEVSASPRAAIKHRHSEH